MASDVFRRRFGYETMADVIGASNEAEIGCVIAGNWTFHAFRVY